MKTMALVFLVLFSLTAFGSEVSTSVSCSTTDGFFSGSQTFRTEDIGFSGPELKDILLGQKQTEEDRMPYPSHIAVAPRVSNVQEIFLNLGQAPLGYKKTVYFTLISKNLVSMAVFCTVSQFRAGL